MTDLGSESGGPQRAAEDAMAGQAAELAADDAAIVEQAAELATEITEGDKVAGRRRLADSIAATARSGAAAARSGARVTGRGVRAARRGAGSGGGRLSAQVVAMAQRLRIRDQAALRAQFPGKSTEEIADALITGRRGRRRRSAGRWGRGRRCRCCPPSRPRW